MKRKCAPALAFALFLAAAGPASAQEEAVDQPPPVSVRLTVVPLGYFVYAADAGTNYNYFDSPLHELTLEVEYRPFARFGFQLTVDIKGYAWDDMDSQYAFINFWGVPSLRVGAGVNFHLLRVASPFDLFIACDIGYEHYIVDEVDFFPGLGLSLGIGFVWRLAPFLGFGARVAAHYSTYAGGPYISDPSQVRYPFELAEVAAGVTVGFYF